MYSLVSFLCAEFKNKEKLVNLACFSTTRIYSGFALYTEIFHVVRVLLHRDGRIPFKETVCSK
jgi:hypothetical protein